MCLERREEFKTRKYAWKIFRTSKAGGLRGRWFRTKRPYKRGVWLNENSWRKDTQIETLDFHSALEDGRYVTGFHSYVTKKDALFNMSMLYPQYFTIIKVQIKDVVITGRQNRERVIVHKKMLIPKE